MALTDGTNCGFVTAAPTVDPEATSGTQVDRHISCKFTSPAGGAGAFTVTELGQWIDTISVSDDYSWEMAIYTHDAVNDLPEAIVGSKVTQTVPQASGDAWYSEACNISIDGSTTYWLVIATETGGAENYNFQSTGGQVLEVEAGNPLPLDDPYNNTGGSTFGSYLASFYAVYEAAGGGTTYSVTASDGITFTDTSAATLTMNVSAGEQSNMADTSLAAITMAVAAADGLTLTDTAAGVLQQLVSVADGISISDTASETLTLNLTLADGASMADAVQAAFTFLVAAGDGVTMTDVTAIPTTISGLVTVTISSTVASVVITSAGPSGTVTGAGPTTGVS